MTSNDESGDDGADAGGSGGRQRVERSHRSRDERGHTGVVAGRESESGGYASDHRTPESGGYASESERTGSGTSRSRVGRVQGSLGNQAVQRLADDGVQRAATGGGSGDRFEREARRVARAAVRPGRQRDPDRKSFRSGESSPDRETPGPQRAAAKGGQRSGGAVRDSDRAADTPTGSDRAAGTDDGRALPGSVRGEFERRLGYDFGGVRVHTGARADALARDLDAVAFTVGRDVFFRAGAYQPATVGGRRLLAHELTHVVQQGESEPLAGRRDATGRTASAEGTGRTTTAGEATPSIDRTEDATVRRQAFGLGLGPGMLLGGTWLGLGRDMKLRLVDTAIDAALTTIDNFPGQAMLGGLWTFVRPGLRGFYQRLRAAKPEAKVTAVDKLARIMSGQSFQYAKGLLIGTVKGFFVDGLWGIVEALEMVVSGLGKLWDFLWAVRDLVGAFPDQVQALFDTARQLGATVAANIGPAMAEVENLLTDPEAVATLVGPIVEAGKTKAADIGNTVAGKLLEFFTKPGAEATVGRVTGRVVGMVLFEAVFAYLTAGVGAAVTAIKAVGKKLAALSARAAGSVLRVFKVLLPYFDTVIDAVEAAGRFLKDRVLGTVADKVGEFLETLKDLFRRFLKHCHESKIDCDFPDQGASKADEAGGAASKADEAGGSAGRTTSKTDEAGETASKGRKRGDRDAPERERRPGEKGERGPEEPAAPSRVPTGELTENARAWVDGLELTDTARSLAGAPDHVRGAINRFHGRRGFDTVVSEYLQGQKKLADGQEFAMKFAFREARDPSAVQFEQLTKRQIRIGEGFSGPANRAEDRLTDVIIDGTRYEMKSHEFGVKRFLDEMNVKKYVKQLEKDLSAQPHLLGRPEKLDVRWVFDSRKTGLSPDELADEISDGWTRKLKREARERFDESGTGPAGAGPSLQEVERRIENDSETIRRALRTIIQVY